MNKPSTSKRKIYFINKYFQKRFILAYVIMVFFGVIISNMILFTLLKKALSRSIYSAHLQTKEMGDIISTPLLFTVIISISMATAAAIALILFFCRRSEKSLHSISLGLNALKKGDLTARLDYKGKAAFTELIYRFNSSTTDFAAKINKIKDSMSKILETTEDGTIKSSQNRIYMLNIINEIETELSEINLKQP